ncbi:hypothetical protein [Haliangium sp.]|uniref:hypothetical protein n=1 Tax=Haliangium sp. TaxID=2663208 RepID=UPI003D128CE6
MTDSVYAPRSSRAPRPRPTLAAGLALVLAALVAGCGGKSPVPEAPEPRRPPEVAGNDDQKKVPDDCAPITDEGQEPPVSYKERSVVEAKNLAEEGFAMLRQAENPKLPVPEREKMVVEAVDRFITALLADPYNVHATYNLAAAYARIGREQCSVNMLDRLTGLHRLASLHDEVEDKLDRLLGRGRYRNDLDPDFQELRDDERFREVIKKFRK